MNRLKFGSLKQLLLLKRPKSSKAGTLFNSVSTLQYSSILSLNRQFKTSGWLASDSFRNPQDELKQLNLPTNSNSPEVTFDELKEEDEDEDEYFFDSELEIEEDENCVFDSEASFEGELSSGNKLVSCLLSLRYVHIVIAYINLVSNTDSLAQSLPRQRKPIKLNEADLVEKFIKGSGNGGQAINKTNSCVELKHIPTGIVVHNQQTRSQAINRKIARKIMIGKLDELINGKLAKSQVKANKVNKQRAKSIKRTRIKLEKNATLLNSLKSAPATLDPEKDADISPKAAKLIARLKKQQDKKDRKLARKDFKIDPTLLPLTPTKP